MNNPTTDEWTSEEVTTPHHGKWPGLLYITEVGGRRLGSMNEQEAKAVVDAHNAALAAERESRDGFRRALEQRIAEVDQLREQLAAERERYPKFAGELAERAELQLAAERRKQHHAANAIAKLDEQLAAEREKYNQAVDHLTQLGVETARKLQDQLAAAVEALKEIRLHPQMYEIANAALAKIGEKL